MTPLERVRKAIIAAVPEIVPCGYCKECRAKNEWWCENRRPITLADVLRAIEAV